MLKTIKHQDTGELVAVAKLLTGYVKTSEKIEDADSYIKLNGIFDASFTAYMVTWQTNHKCTPDGIIGPDTWRAIAKAAPTCSTSKNRKSGYTFALQVLLGGNLTPDAIYGSRTKAAVAALQSATGLSADGVCGAKTWNAIIVGDDVKPEPVPGKFVQPVDYKQGAKPWGPKMYSNHNDPNQTMSNSGCGPTAMADIVATLKDKNATPWTLAQLSMKWGDRTYNSGTSWNFFKHVAEYYKFTKMIQTKNLESLKACLDAGGYVVCSMGPGYWTKGGHFICAWKYDSKSIYCNDPASSKRKHQDQTDFKKESKQYFCFYPDVKGDTGEGDTVHGTVGGVSGGTTDSTRQPVKRGSNIVDISKYQPTVDYDKLIADTSLIIIRAGYSGTGGGISKDQKFDLHASELKKRGVRFGVYFYSIATTEAKALEEARMFYQYAKDYNPLFWACDMEKQEISNGAFTAFASELRRLGADKVGCYVANHLYQKFDYDSVRDKFDFTWIPRYGSTKPVHKCDLWQYTSTGRVNGISGNVDLNRVTGEGHDLKWFTGE